MKKIEDLFKSALKDQELPYNENAWNQMSKKLDARGGASGNLKWLLGAAGIAVITVGTLLYLNNNNKDVQKNISQSLASTNQNTENTNSNDIDSNQRESPFVLIPKTVTNRDICKVFNFNTNTWLFKYRIF